MMKRKAQNVLAGRGYQSSRRNSPPNLSFEANNTPLTMMAEQQQFIILLNKMKVLIAIIESLQEVAVNNQQQLMGPVTLIITSKLS